MNRNTKLVIGGVAVAILAWWILPNWIAALIVLAVVAAPVAGYLMLDPSQRQRLKRIRSRKQLGG